MSNWLLILVAYTNIPRQGITLNAYHYKFLKLLVALATRASEKI